MPQCGVMRTYSSLLRAASLRLGTVCRHVPTCHHQWRFSSSTRESHSSQPPTSPSSQQTDTANIGALLATPTWSVRSLLPSATSSTSSVAASSNDTITPTLLRHLLRLCALPIPAPSSAEEAALLDTLRTQLHFVRAVQAVDVGSDVQPLTAIRDETRAGRAEAREAVERGVLETLRGEEEDAYSQRPAVGGVGAGGAGGMERRPLRRKRRRRAGAVAGTREMERKEDGQKGEANDWDVFANAARRVQRYFVVEGGQSHE